MASAFSNRIFTALALLPTVLTLSAVELLPPGHRPLPLGVHALVGAKVFVKPGEALDSATVVIRDGLIESVGEKVEPPADARVWDMKGLTIYAGFIDPYFNPGSKPAPEAPAPKPDLTAGRFFGVAGGETDPGGAGAGYEVAQVSPERRVARTYAPDLKALEKMRDLGFTTANVVSEKGIFRGTTAFVALSDTDPNRSIISADVFQQVSLKTENAKEDVYPESLMGVVAVIRQTFFDAQRYGLDTGDFLKNPQRRRPEFNPALEALLPASNRKMRVLIEPDNALMVDRVTRLAEELKLDLCLVSSGEEWRRPALAKAANAPFIVRLDFPELSKMPGEDDWNDISLDQLRAWDWAPENPALLRQQNLEVALTTDGLAEKKNFRKNLKGAIERGFSETDALAALTTVPAKICGMEASLGTVEKGKLANLTIVSGNYFDPASKVREVWIDGRNYHGPIEKAETPKEKKDDEPKEILPRIARSPLEGRGPLEGPATFVVSGATLWTCGEKGILTNVDFVVENGKIRELWSNEKSHTWSGASVNAAGMHITPGLIDCHSHSAILGNVNESSLPSTAMVRIGDVVNSESDNLHEELAGGLTVANLLHGSANPIGGQNQVIKLRDGASAEELKFDGAKPGIKFALGENVKQSNWGDKHTTRFPQTRMGVRAFIQNRFVAAQQYAIEWEQFQTSGGVPPRRDLELEAIDEIIRGDRLIHCHSYRQDEILMMIRLMESFGVKIGTFQHVLEGYKIADEIAAHGAGVSTFADWWAYKFEVYDAIPFNGSLMRDRGVLVSFNSDSPDLSRRLNTEAAKAVKFGGASEEEALKFVTINPAKQLQIDQRVGSLAPGKDADFVLWSKSPLDSTTVCLQTWIDGKKYFDRSLEADRSGVLEVERIALLEKARKILKAGGDSAKPDEAGKKKFFKRSLEHLHDHEERHCDDE
ncbi:MAG: amidohydrolase family protein [Verrucomicrobiota bacterium]